MQHRLVVLILGAMLSAAMVTPVLAQAADQEDLTSIRKAVESYVAAFNAADAPAVAACWSKAGVFVTGEGERLQGEEALTAYFQEMFADNPGLQLIVEVSSLRTLTPDVAIEEGTAFTTRDGEPEGESTYVAIHRKEESGWKLDTVRETVVATEDGEEGPLDGLSWLIGEWNDASQEGVEVKSTYHWADGGKFIVHTFNLVVDDQVDLRGTQVIGWDPAAETIRSWLFDSDGGFGESVWTPGEEDGDWTVESQSTLPDGRQGTAVHHYHRVGADEFTWSSTDRVVDGEAIEDVAPITVHRAPPAK